MLMNNLKTGDVVICKDSSISLGALTVGKTYVIEGVGPTWSVTVEGRLWSYLRFDLVDRPPTPVLTGMTKFFKERGIK
jgi:hypothetical protein